MFRNNNRKFALIFVSTESLYYENTVKIKSLYEVCMKEIL